MCCCVVIAVSGCGSSSRASSSFVPCSVAHRTYDLKRKQQGQPHLLAVAERAGGSVIYAVSPSGFVFASRNEGCAWTRFGRRVPGLPDGVVAIDPAKPSVMFAENGDAIARTADAGAHWAKVDLPGGARAKSVLFAGEGGRTVYAWGGVPGGNGGFKLEGPPGEMFRSDDGGVTWRKVANPDPYGTGYVGVAASRPRTVYVGTDSGLFLTTDGGGSWTGRTNGLPSLYGQPPTIDAVAVSPTDSSLAFADAMQKTGMSGHAVGWMNSDPLETIFRTTDGGKSWQPALTGEFGADNGIVFAPHSARTAYALVLRANRARTNSTPGELYVTHDGGTSWHALPGRVPGPCRYPGADPCGDSHAITTLMVDPLHENVLYGETGGGRFARSVNGGRSWTFMPMPPSK